MVAIVTCLYTNEVNNERGLIGDHGQAFHIKIDSQNILFDTGTKSETLLHNMNILGISPHAIDKIVFSHGHYDHTRALPGLLDVINPKSPIPIFGHPAILENKYFKSGIIKRNISFPDLSPDQKVKVQFNFSKNPIKVTQALSTTGEVTNRPYKDGREPNAFHSLPDGGAEVDNVSDDQSLILHTEKGLVVITGCCHAGLLNTLEQIRNLYPDEPILRVIGGTHLVKSSKTEIEEIANILEEKYNTPYLNLNHCTDNFPLPLAKKTKATKILQKRFGDDKVNICSVGTSFTFQLAKSHSFSKTTS